MAKDHDAEELIHMRKSKCKFCQFVFIFSIKLNQCKRLMWYMEVNAECRLQHQDVHLEMRFYTQFFYSESNEQVEKWRVTH